MTYIALARKWRPRQFSQLVGQDHVNKALINSLDQKRLHHAYLFTGTRGVGKTSLARLLAKALNCKQGISSEPCLTCEACLAIEQGRFVDLIEIDGASRTRVEDTRDLLDNVQYLPTSGRFKIYLIDEVHMLSQHSFNALLKTLEEPPEHVKFLLATTDPQKIPVTVLSRCLQFNLRHVQPDIICQHLEHILQQESVSFDKQALVLLAKAARGSIRDALSLLDQAIASNPNHLREEDVKASLGYTQQDYALALLQALANQDPQTLMQISKAIAIHGGHFHYVLDEMLHDLHQINLCQMLPNAASEILNPEPELLALSASFTPEDVQLLYQIALKGLEDLPLAPSVSVGFDMLILRMYAFRPAALVTPPLSLSASTKTLEAPASAPKPAAISEAPTAAPETTPPPTKKANLDWEALLPHLKLSGLALTAAENAEFIQRDQSTIQLRVDTGHQSLFTPTVIKRIEQGLTNHYNEVIKLHIQHDKDVSSSPAQQRKKAQIKQHEEAEAQLQSDPFFRQLQETFSAEVVKDSITTAEEG